MMLPPSRASIRSPPCRAVQPARLRADRRIPAQQEIPATSSPPASASPSRRSRSPPVPTGAPKTGWQLHDPGEHGQRDRAQHQADLEGRSADAKGRVGTRSAYQPTCGRQGAAFVAPAPDPAAQRQLEQEGQVGAPGQIGFEKYFLQDEAATPAHLREAYVLKALGIMRLKVSSGPAAGIFPVTSPDSGGCCYNVDGMEDKQSGQQPRPLLSAPANRRGEMPDLGRRRGPYCLPAGLRRQRFLLRRGRAASRFQLELPSPISSSRRWASTTPSSFSAAHASRAGRGRAPTAKAQASGDAAAIRRAQALLRNAHYYDKVAPLRPAGDDQDPRQDKLYIATGGGFSIMGGQPRARPNVLIRTQHPAAARWETQSTSAPSSASSSTTSRCAKMHFLMRAKALVAFPAASARWTSCSRSSRWCNAARQAGADLPVRQRILAAPDQLRAAGRRRRDLAEDLAVPVCGQTERAWEGIKQFYNLPDACSCGSA